MPDFTQIGLEIWKVLTEIRLLSCVQVKFHGAEFQETRPCSKNFVKELFRKFLYILVDCYSSILGHIQIWGVGGTDGQTDSRMRVVAILNVSL